MAANKTITAGANGEYAFASGLSSGTLSIVKNGDDLRKIVVDTVMQAAENGEFVIRDSFSKADIPLSQLSMRPGVLVGAIYRNGRFILPRGADVIKPGDTVLIITTIKGVNDISDFFQ